ncbi:anti-sigma factor [Tuwongella immobilis]|uniref:Zinc-finger domain-containing protein n=1 Tax=Tuwongella immobilis TaxID=692036 RepID=A0A6C2YSV0_9BACT|nr:hypothetical protein [Tuwongella immobilis]VIP04454.1 Uncharacterized protein OS=Blastopirellula marina DSM 3645 GN=DSM3645_00340 PE=4 SV=1 [Tuwongella immobilis]VTS06270.1 Uncharacterized protein OS=Blastopirellula marina DSM 3645 GN=DSM3645_00340 PE=4 SV=1 [Tuwongella immobilis]
MAEQPICLPEQITREQLHAFLEDALGERESALIERLLRTSPELRQRLDDVRRQRDQGDHSIGQIWRRDRLSCPTREQISGYLLGVHDEAFADYIRFHIEVIGCPFCQANLIDLKHQAEAQAAGTAARRRQTLFQSSAGRLPQKPG